MCFCRQIKMKRSVSIVIAVILVTAILAGCGSTSVNKTNGKESSNTSTVDKQKDKAIFTLYFANEDNSALPSEKQELELIDDNRIKTAVEALLKGPKNAGLRKTIPDGTKLLNSYLKDGLAVVDFSGEYSSANDIAEIVERISVVNTLTEIEGVNKVKILVEGKDLIGPSGEPFGELGRIALDEQGRPVPGEIKKLVLYFGNNNSDALIVEDREVAVNKGDSIEKVIIDELIRGSENKELSSPIPEGTRLLSVNTTDGICTVNFSGEIIEKHPGGSAGELITLYSVVNSLTELDWVKKVQFLIEGTQREAFIHLELDHPLERDESIIQK
ncbi:MAG: GerMN domain-containing protein [Clostridia bacterium]|nr:GerMN domain-containing protein [Clostridia bacterium]